MRGMNYSAFEQSNWTLTVILFIVRTTRRLSLFSELPWIFFFHLYLSSINPNPHRFREAMFLTWFSNRSYSDHLYFTSIYAFLAWKTHSNSFLRWQSNFAYVVVVLTPSQRWQYILLSLLLVSSFLDFIVDGCAIFVCFQSIVRTSCKLRRNLGWRL